MSAERISLTEAAEPVDVVDFEKERELLVSAKKKFLAVCAVWETPGLINAEPPRLRIETVSIGDMSLSNS